MNGNDKLILEVAFEIASALISNGLKEERFMDLPEDERAEAIVRSVVMGSLTTLEFFTDLFGEELVNDIMGELEELSEELAEELEELGEEFDDEDNDIRPRFSTDINTDMDRER